jgi:hypothetical protein
MLACTNSFELYGIDAGLVTVRQTLARPPLL